MAVDMLKLINGAFQLEASDIHLVTGAPPTFRVAGYLIPTDFAVMTPDGVRSCIEFLAGCSSHEVSDLNQVQKQANAVDFSCEIENVGRMRVHVFREKGNFGVNVRLISSSIPTVSRLGLPQVLIDICSRRGLTLVTGPTGSGKSTTLAALVRWCLEHKGYRVVTIEDPIEYRFPHYKGIVTQKEVGIDCVCFHEGLVAALREDPDVIVLGELRDLASADATLTASETGHLVIATMHTPTATRALDRFVDLFPVGRQELARHSLSRALNGVFVQRLLPSIDHTRRLLASEVLVATPAVRNLIRRGEYQQINSSIEAGHKLGMISMSRSIQDLVSRGLVQLEDVTDEVEPFE